MKNNKYPITMPQYSIHAQECAFPESDINVLYFVIQIQEAVCEEWMREAIVTFLKAHMAVHTRISMDGNTPMQYFETEETIQIPVVDLSKIEQEKREAIYTKWGQKPFVYLDSTLWDFRILKISDTQSGVFCKFHHIWCDGWTTGLIWSEILHNYCCLKAGKKLEATKEQAFTSVIQAGMAYQAGAEYQQDKMFFQEYLQGVESKSYDVRVGQEANFDKSAQRSLTFSVSKEFSERINAYCRQWKVTPYSVFMGALAVYESGIESKKEAVLGTARLNRDTPGEREIVGQFVAEIPLRIKVNGEDTFSELCQRILEESRTVALHKRYSMMEIIKDLRHTSSFDGKLLRYALSFQREKIDLGEYTLPITMWFGSPSVCTECAIIHVVDLLEEGYQVFYDYQKVYYNPKTIQNLHESILEIIEKGMNHETMIFQLPLVGQAQQKALSMPSNESVDFISGQPTILDMLQACVNKTPQRQALSGVDGSYSFAELNQVSASIAAYLQKKGIQTEDAVGVFLPRTCGTVLALLGIMRCGGSFVLMDQSYPKERIRTIMQDSHMKQVITDEIGQAKLDEGIPRILIESIEPAIFTDRPIQKNQTCYMIYTSGTTGKPKGVQISHAAIYNLLQPSHTNIVADIAANGETALAMGAFSFDIFLFEVFTNLMNGVGVVIAAQEQMEDPIKLACLMEEAEINVLYGTPSRLLAYCEFEKFKQVFKQVKVVLSAGEAFPEILYPTLHHLAPQCHIYNGYGPTEATIGTSFQRVDGGKITLGTPVVNYKLRCMDNWGRLLPYGEVGELYIGGAGLAKGYTDSLLTHKFFVEVQGERFYKSGDWVYRQENDELIFVGRKDNQIKLRGFRIELEEIEAALRAYTTIKEAAVLVKKSGEAKFLCAFYTSEIELKEEELKKVLAERLPYYMIPSVFQYINQMPRTENGKSDKQKLEEQEVHYQQEYVSPETEMQKELAKIVEKVLEIDKVGLDDNFFEIGGDSLSVALYAVEALAYGIEFEYADIFKYPTIRQFSCYIDKKNEKKMTDLEVTEYDYTDITEFLKRHREEVGETIVKRPMQRVLLTGATGYLGIHILFELLTHTQATVYCLLRDKGKRTPQKILNGKLFYYFEKSLMDFPEERVQICVGDMVKGNLIDRLEDIQLDTVINCAADVAHYTYGSHMREINTESLYQLTKLCKVKKADLIHISTISIGQFAPLEEAERKGEFSEEDFYFGQDLSNEYIRSKFLAERIILEAMARGELKGFIVRLGNLQGRYRDGEFQINNKSNAFVTRMKSYVKMGFLPKAELEGEVDYSPIDYVAEAICLLGRYRTKQCIYHILNNKETKKAYFYQALEKQGYSICELEQEEYHERVAKLLKTQEGKRLLANIMGELTAKMQEKKELQITCKVTSSILKKLSFTWPEIDKGDLEVYIQNLKTLGLFN